MLDLAQRVSPFASDIVLAAIPHFLPGPAAPGWSRREEVRAALAP